MYYIGVDPGKKGALVVLDGDVRYACSWSEDDKGLKTKLFTQDRASRDRLSLDFLKTHMLLYRPYVLAVEGLKWMGPGRPGIIQCAENAGYLLGLLASDAEKVYRPFSVNWRKNVLGISERKGGAALKRFSVDTANRLYDMGSLSRVEHACDAAHIARWANYWHRIQEAQNA